ncbi:Eco57I restriction-modification methylase domain-containing protein, partial [Candidatus Parcubacteria bacterium]|nr:Eco57I restriction-modification methylase domain-containing protein [Candidatus Parcubacteria bacterium]
LQEIKIIDPAVGSGAFPVGILQEMTAIRVFCQSHILRKPKSSYDIKKEILENNIYGVDIDHGAIDIARLRFWLSLVVDANLFDVEPLPNLDFKLTTANTLLKLDEQQGLDDHAELLEKMKEFREKYFRARTKNGKEKIQKSFDRLIKSNFNLFASDRQKQIMTYNPFSPSSVAQFFDPEFMFGVKEFDLVIGNPPYFQLQKNKIVSEELIKQKYKTFSKSSDIYCIFYERGIKLLKNEGILIYITSNSWMKTKYGLLLRKFIKNNSSPLTLINFKSLKIFNSAVVESNILLLKKTQNKDKLQAINIAVEKNSFQDLNNYFKKNKVTIDKLNDEGWIIGNQDDMKLMLKLEKETTPLKKMDCKIYIGIINGFNSAYIINSKTRDDLINKDPNSELIIKPLLRGRDVSRYYYDWGDVWLINTHNGIRGLESRIDVKKDYPAIYEYLLRFKPELEVRKNKGSHWTNLRNCKYFNEFEKPKIIWGELSDKPKFTLDSDGFYPEATLFAMVGKNLEYILCILNSKLGLWYFQQIATSSGMGTNRWKKYKIEQIPIKELSEKDQKPFRNIIEQLLTITSATKYDSKNPPIEQKELEKEIDEMVYELYGLTEEEISIIEK